MLDFITSTLHWILSKGVTISSHTSMSISAKMKFDQLKGISRYLLKYYQCVKYIRLSHKCLRFFLHYQKWIAFCKLTIILVFFCMLIEVVALVLKISFWYLLFLLFINEVKTAINHSSFLLNANLIWFRIPRIEGESQFFMEMGLL